MGKCSFKMKRQNQRKRNIWTTTTAKKHTEKWKYQMAHEKRFSQFFGKRQKCIPFFSVVKNKKYRTRNKNKIIQQHQNLKEMKKCIKPNIRYSEFVAEVEHRPEFQWNDTMNHLHIFAICLKRFILCQYWWAKQIKSERNETKRYTNDHGASVIHCQRHLVVWMGALLPRDTHF